MPAPPLRARIGSSLLDPAGEVGDDVIGELALGRHLELALVFQHFDQQALFRMSRHEARPGIASLEERLARIDQQAASLLFRFHRVARVAVFREDGPNLLLEKRDALGIVGVGRGGETRA